MRVVHISKVAGIAGSEGHLLMLLPALARQGVEVSMLVLEDPRRTAGAFCREMVARGIPCETLPVWGHVDPALLGRIAAYLRGLQPDIVHTHLIHADLYGLLAARWAGVQHAISSRHNNTPFHGRPLINWLKRTAMRRADRVIAISYAVARFVAEVERVDAGKIVTIHYGFEPLDYPPDAREAARAEMGLPPGAPVIGMFGRLIPQKGIDVLLDALPQVLQQHPDARLLIVGDGVLRATLEAQAQALGLDGVVTFAGWVERAYRLMPACDLIVMSSRLEGFGLVALEAMSAARPMVASRASSLPEIVVDGETGLLVPPEDAPALAEAIAALLGDPAHAAALGQAGLRRLRAEFSVDKMVNATYGVYVDVLGTA